jgi:hypothetical protein
MVMQCECKMEKIIGLVVEPWGFLWLGVVALMLSSTPANSEERVGILRAVPQLYIYHGTTANVHICQN